MSQKTDSMHRLAMVAAIAAFALPSFADRATDHLKRIEDFRESVYLCQAGERAIGYGFTSADMIAKGHITRAEADKELERLCQNIRRQIRKELKGQPLTDGETAALVSFVYNVGWRNFKNSTILKKIRQGKRGVEVGEEFRRWVYVTKGGKKIRSRGLQKRRLSEAVMFSNR